MSAIFLEKLFEHNNWANQKIIEACSALSDEQLDAEPQSITKGTIRATLTHLVSSQCGYLALLTLPVDERPNTLIEFAESEEGLLALAKGKQKPFGNPLRTTDGYFVEPWVVMLQVLNHAAEHREQICSMLSDLGITPPDLDGWSYGEAANALIPISSQAHDS